MLHVPAAAPPWALESLWALPASQLARWGATPLTIAVLASSDAERLGALHASLSAAARAAANGVPSLAQPPGARSPSLPRDRTSVSIMLGHAAPAAVATFAQRGWTWPRHAKHVRYRVEPVGGRCASAAQREAIRVLEAWEPALPRSSESRSTGSDGRAAAAGEGAEWALVLGDDVELAEGFYVYVRAFLASADARGVEVAGRTDRLLGLALGAPMGSDGNAGGAQAGRLRVPARCGTVYTAAAWHEFRQFASERLGLASVGAACGEKETAPAQQQETTWTATQQQFMTQRGLALLYPGVRLCRRRGDEEELASGTEVAAAVARLPSINLASAP